MSLWGRKRKKHNTYCAFCRTPRVIFRKRNISLGNIISSVLGSGVLMWVLWGQPDARVFVVFVCLLAIAEVLVQIRWRMSVVCRVCGFDPVLYVKEPAQAVRLVKEALDRRRQSPASLLANPLNLPSLSPERAKALSFQEGEASKPATTGRLMSRDA